MSCTQAPERGAARLGWKAASGPLDRYLPEVAGGTALLSSPNAFVVATVADDGTCRRSNGQLVGLEDVFEARAFTPDRELRWVRRPDGGQAVILGEQVVGDSPNDEKSGLEMRETGYLLWGEWREPAAPAGWVRLHAARIGHLDVPEPKGGRATGLARDRVSVKVREYVAIGEYGNAYVYDERLVGLVAGEVTGA